MINVDKTRLMTKCAVYEKNAGSEDIPASAFYKPDFVIREAVRSILYATLGYISLLTLIVLFNMNLFIERIYNADYRSYVYIAVFAYVIIVFAYGMLGWITSSYKYKKAGERLEKYSRLLEKIDKFN